MSERATRLALLPTAYSCDRAKGQFLRVDPGELPRGSPRSSVSFKWFLSSDCEVRSFTSWTMELELSGWLKPSRLRVRIDYVRPA